MRTINGIHAENKGFSWDVEERDRITDASGGICMLDTLLTDVENGWWYPKLRAQFGPQFLIVIRMYPEAGWANNAGFHWTEVNPEAWAKQCSLRLNDERLQYNGLTPFEDPYVIVTPYNEQDLAAEGHSGAAVMGRPHIELGVWRYIWETNYRWNQAFRALKPGCAIGSAAMAGGHDIVGYPPEWEYKIPEATRYLNDCDVICLHAYLHPDGRGTRPDNGGWWDGALRCLRPKGQREAQGDPPINGMTDPGGIVVQYPHKPFVVKEFGNFCHHDTATVERTMQGYNECYRAYSESGRCLLVTPFLWNSGDEHRENRIRGNWPLTRALQGMQRYPAADWPPAVPPVVPPGGGETMSTFHLGSIDITDLRDSLPVHATLKYDWRLMQAIKRIVIHHSATSVTATAEQFARYHVDHHGWPGIGYHFVVTANGEIQYVNDHTLITYGVADQNANSVHICLVGDFTSTPPPAAQLQAARRLIDNYHLAMGQVYPVVGHRDIGDSSCPGDTWPQWKAQLIEIVLPEVDWKAECERMRRELETATTRLAAANQRTTEHTSIAKAAISMLEKIK